MKSYGIERQTQLIAVVPILMMTILLESYYVYTRFADLEDGLLDRSRLMVHQIASSSEFAVFSGNRSLLLENVNAALAQQDFSRVVVLDADAKPLADRPIAGSGQYQALLAKADSTNPVYLDDNVLVLYEPIFPAQIKLGELDRLDAQPASADKPIGAVIMEVSKYRLNRLKHQVLLYSLGITLLILVTALMLALWVARGITRPIKGMSHAIRSFAEGNLDTRIVPLPKSFELNVLARGFNQMAQKLQYDQKFLENRIAERTAALAASEHEARTLIENSPDMIARYDRDCRRIYVNPAFSASVEGGSAALLGKRPSESPGGPDSDIYEARIKEVFATGETEHFEIKWPGLGGKVICSSVRLAAERDLSGSIISVLSVAHDITALNESKDELNRKELAKSRFLSAAGHDLRQPLAAANLYIDTLRFTNPSPEQDRIIQRLDQSMSTFNELLDALLNISRLDAGVIKPEWSAINVINIFNWLEQTFEPMARSKQLGFRLHFPMEEMLVIHSDINLLKSVLMNLVSNAIKYTTTGTILISVRRRGSNALFQVWDTGIGIKPEHADHIFDEFYQVNNAQRDRSKGLGLGLAIARRAILLLGGEITCRSRIGRGSVFSFSLPQENSHEAAMPRLNASSAPLDAARMTFAQGKFFIVVEDDQLVAEAMSRTLEIMGGKVECFNNGEDALRYKDIGRADYYIVDYMLDGVFNGIQFLNRLRQQLGNDIKAVLMSGDTSPAFIREAENFDWPVMHKPVSISNLIARLGEQHSINI